jgi:hypothetical protein
MEDFSKPLKAGQTFAQFGNSLSNILAAGDLKEAAYLIAKAKKNGQTIMLAMGGHPVKVGLGPIIIDLLEKGLFDSISTNGSVMVHDAEIALAGTTSEDVGASLGKGQFGVTAETGALINKAASLASQNGTGLGCALGQIILKEDPPYASNSLFATAARLKIPFTVHVALGTDVYHIHPDCEVSSLGQSSMDDFKTFCKLVATLQEGVFINLGSAVIMPEIFLKALTLTRNLGFEQNHLTTINLDFIHQYRSSENVVKRPTQENGHGFYFIGHHEIMFPLLMSLVLENLSTL